MVVRSGEQLSRIGSIAEVFDDHTPLALMASGRFEDRAFTLIGRLQYKSSTGLWTEWNALFDGGDTAFLSEDNGAYVMARPHALRSELPDASQFQVGASVAVDGTPYSVASNDLVALVSAQGELPKLPAPGVSFPSVELRSASGEVLSLEYAPGAPGQPLAASLGVAVLLEDLRLSGLRDESVRNEQGARQFSCPNCGAPVTLQLDTTKSLTCRNCNSIIDVSAGIGGELRHAQQSEPVSPLIPLGSMGRLQGVDWQVVGFQHRMGQAPDDDEQFGWSEYLLFNRSRGFTFLVDAEDGWSVVKPVTGAPKLSGNGQSANYLGLTYHLDYSYNAETRYVAGEFYWPVERGQRSVNRDYSLAGSMLSSEKTPSELTWSSGNKIGSDAVVTAFNMKDRIDRFKRSDASPLSSKPALGCGTIILILIVLVILVAILSTCSGGTGSGYSSGYGRAQFGRIVRRLLERRRPQVTPISGVLHEH
ncbi:MAG: hypothetical protein JWP52_3365 [Rhizobacter sp.]|nr:hypothetical protein [Rhizobacter sp.]